MLYSTLQQYLFARIFLHTFFMSKCVKQKSKRTYWFNRSRARHSVHFNLNIMHVYITCNTDMGQQLVRCRQRIYVGLTNKFVENIVLTNTANKY